MNFYKKVYNDKNTNDVSTSIDNLIDNVKKTDKDEYKHFYDLPYAREVSERYGLPNYTCKVKSPRYDQDVKNANKSCGTGKDYEFVEDIYQ